MILALLSDVRRNDVCHDVTAVCLAEIDEMMSRSRACMQDLKIRSPFNVIK